MAKEGLGKSLRRSILYLDSNPSLIVVGNFFQIYRLHSMHLKPTQTQHIHTSHTDLCPGQVGLKWPQHTGAELAHAVRVPEHVLGGQQHTLVAAGVAEDLPAHPTKAIRNTNGGHCTRGGHWVRVCGVYV